MPHTQGPWHPFYAGSGLYQIFDLAGEEIASLDRGQDKNQDETWDNSRLIAQAPAMYELLKELEWSSEDHLHHATCPLCGMYSEEFHPSGGHEPDCRLAAVLKAAEGTPNA